MDEGCAALGFHHTCRHTHTALHCMELAGTYLSTSQVLQEHHKKGVDLGSHEDRALY